MSSVTSASSRSITPVSRASLDPKWYSSPPLETPAARAVASIVAERSPSSMRIASKASSTLSRACGGRLMRSIVSSATSTLR